jgi:hypothetical protein
VILRAKFVHQSKHDMLSPKLFQGLRHFFQTAYEQNSEKTKGGRNLSSSGSGVPE